MLADRALGHFTRFVTDVPLEDPLTGQRTLRTEALRRPHGFAAAPLLG